MYFYYDICDHLSYTHMKTPFISVVYQQHLINAAILGLNDHLYTTRFRTGLLFIITFSVHEDESNVTYTSEYGISIVVKS